MPLLYFFAAPLSFFFKNIIRYRRQTILKNIQYCFPEKTAEEHTYIQNEFYKNLSDILLESIKGLSMSERDFSSRFKWVKNSHLEDAIAHGRDLVILSAHINNWEWGGKAMETMAGVHLVGYVKALKNPYINAYLKRKRSGPSASIITSLDQLPQVRRNTGQILALAFIMDQYPAPDQKRHSVRFFNRDTCFHGGPARYAFLRKLPCFFAYIERIARGHYVLHIEELEFSAFSGPEEITQAYARKLEERIRQIPGQWLWSHKRFKDTLTY